VDFGEVDDRKDLCHSECGAQNTTSKQIDLPGRKFIDRSAELTDAGKVQEQLMAALPSERDMKDAILRLVAVYPRDWEALIDDPAIRRAAEDAFEFHFIRRPQVQVRLRLAGDKPIASLQPSELIDLYWKSVPPAEDQPEALNALAGEIIHAVEMGRSVGDGEQTL
jgi:hypothetical protein